MYKRQLWMMFFLIWFYSELSVNALELEGTLDYEEVQSVIDDMLPKEMGLTFSDLVQQLVQGDFKHFFKNVFDFFREKIFFEIRSSKDILIQMIGIVIISAVFTNFSMAFTKTSIAETGFYLTYMLLFTLLLTSFMTAVEVAFGLTQQMLRFMSALVPVFCLAVTLTGNIQTGVWYHQVMIAVLTLTEWFISKGVIVLVHIYVLISLVNHLAKEDMLSKCAELIKTISLWMTKSAFGVVVGIHFIQGLILPAFDSVKNGWLSRFTSAVPGVGDAMGSVFKTVVGSAVLIKNGVGAAGLMILTIVFLLPMLKLIIMVFMYMITQAVVQPIADKRMMACLHTVSEGVTLLMKVEGMVFVLFFLSMAMMASASNIFLAG